MVMLYFLKIKKIHAKTLKFYGLTFTNGEIRKKLRD
jgi:hypothetical protein